MRNRLNDSENLLEPKTMLASASLEEVGTIEFATIDDLPDSISVPEETGQVLQSLFADSLESGFEEASNFSAQGEVLPFTVVSQNRLGVTINPSRDAVFFAHTHPLTEVDSGLF